VPVRRFFSWWLRLLLDVVSYGLLAGLAHAAEYWRRYRRTEAAGLRLRAELSEAGRRRAEAELRALKAELSPHFLGSALQDVSRLMRTDPAAADRVLAQLGDLLRSALARAATQEVTLREELEGLEPFLAIEQARLGDQLVVTREVDDAALDARVPHMILQPLVENAVKHGLAPRRGPGRIELAAHLTRGRLELSVRDNGVGPDAAAQSRGTALRRGVGLSNVRARLVELYGGDASLELRAAPGGGAIARLSLPVGDAERLSAAAGGANRAGHHSVTEQ
jgi:LytS/YehU family sensor histidine kinase